MSHYATQKGGGTMFSDVKQDSYWYPLIERFYRMGVANGYPDGTFRPDAPISRVEMLALLEKYRTRGLSLVKSLSPSVIKIEGRRKDGTGALGSGVILDKDGYIATNAHVAMDGIDPWHTLHVTLDSGSTVYPATVLRGDFTQDIAIIKINADPSLLQPVRVASSIELLDEVYCIGNPLGYTDTVTAGRISCVKRELQGTEWIQTDAAINPGNSGGGAFNFMGELIGLPTWVVVWADSAKTIPVNNVGFITPHYKVQELYHLAHAGKVGFSGEPVAFIV